MQVYKMVTNKARGLVKKYTLQIIWQSCNQLIHKKKQ